MSAVNRIVLNAFLILALVFVQGAGLHGHFERHAQPSVVDHDEHVHGHVHSHWANPGTLDQEHVQAAEMDVVGAGLIRDLPSGSDLFAFVAVWAYALWVVWVCIARLPPKPALIHFRPPRFLRPSLRAPPV